jgi:2-oxoglutarate dehydrogenase E2 component (dihydrolipoamide succinyltransferase)
MPELTDIVLPTDQAEGTSNAVGKWFKQVGDPVVQHEPLLEITTDKVSVEIAAPASGVLTEVLKAEGDPVEPGDVVGRIGAAPAARTGEMPAARRATAAAPPAPAGDAPADTELAPAVRRLLKERGLDPAQIRGTGRGGRITLEDVERHAPGGSGRLVPHSAMRRSIAEHMVRSVAAAPHVTAVFEADLTEVLRHRESHGKVHTLTAYFVRATVTALQAVPEVNSRWRADGLELFDHCNIGIATALPSGGLIVPVLREAERLDLPETAQRLDDLIRRAREERLDPRDVQDGTFTISNHGVSGSLLAAPIVINQPQSAILGIGKLQQRVTVRADGAFEARPMLYVTLTIDHRVLDGFQANAFLTRWVEAIERWT